MNYVIEPLLLNKELEDSTPDIVASGESGSLIIQLTMNSGTKELKLTKYLSIDPRFLSLHGLYSQDAPPDVISSRLSFIDDGPYGQLVVRDKSERSCSAMKLPSPSLGRQASTTARISLCLPSA